VGDTTWWLAISFGLLLGGGGVVCMSRRKNKRAFSVLEKEYRIAGALFGEMPAREVAEKLLGMLGRADWTVEWSDSCSRCDYEQKRVLLQWPHGITLGNQLTAVHEVGHVACGPGFWGNRRVLWLACVCLSGVACVAAGFFGWWWLVVPALACIWSEIVDGWVREIRACRWAVEALSARTESAEVRKFLDARFRLERRYLIAEQAGWALVFASGVCLCWSLGLSVRALLEVL